MQGNLSKFLVRATSISFFSFLFLPLDRKKEGLVKSKTQRGGYVMARGKDARVTVILECTNCVRGGVNNNKESKGISRYVTQKNRHNTPGRLELKKFCPYCYKQTIHGEIKK